MISTFSFIPTDSALPFCSLPPSSFTSVRLVHRPFLSLFSLHPFPLSLLLSVSIHSHYAARVVSNVMATANLARFSSPSIWVGACAGLLASGSTPPSLLSLLIPTASGFPFPLSSIRLSDALRRPHLHRQIDLRWLFRKTVTTTKGKNTSVSVPLPSVQFLHSCALFSAGGVEPTSITFSQFFRTTALYLSRPTSFDPLKSVPGLSDAKPLALQSLPDSHGCPQLQSSVLYPDPSEV